MEREGWGDIDRWVEVEIERKRWKKQRDGERRGRREMGKENHRNRGRKTKGSGDMGIQNERQAGGGRQRTKGKEFVLVTVLST